MHACQEGLGCVAWRGSTTQDDAQDDNTRCTRYHVHLLLSIPSNIDAQTLVAF